MVKYRGYRFNKENQSEINEGEFELAKKELGGDNFVCIHDALDRKNEWLEEIWDEKDAGFPKREEEEYYKNGFSAYWFIEVVGIGRGLLVQDASPIGFIFREEDIKNSNIQIEYK